VQDCSGMPANAKCSGHGMLWWSLCA
jgi:hypothetical protein